VIPYYISVNWIDPEEQNYLQLAESVPADLPIICSTVPKLAKTATDTWLRTLSTKDGRAVNSSINLRRNVEDLRQPPSPAQKSAL
jgi:hypothetical protein